MLVKGALLIKSWCLDPTHLHATSSYHNLFPNASSTFSLSKVFDTATDFEIRRQYKHTTVARGRIMMTSSNGNIFRVTGPLCGEFTGPGKFSTQRPVTRNFDVFFDLRLDKRLSKQPWGWWFETPSWSLWRQFNVLYHCIAMACVCPAIQIVKRVGEQ